MFRTRIRRLALLATGYGFICLLTAGCSQAKEWPKTYPTKGKVVYEDGKPLTTGKTITFTLVSDINATANSDIGPDGAFELNTISIASDADSKLFKGSAVAGEYFVNIWPYPGGAGGGRGSYTLKKKYTINPAEANEITVIMEPFVSGPVK